MNMYVFYILSESPPLSRYSWVLFHSWKEGHWGYKAEI